MNCNKAETAMMQYADKLIKPKTASALARHVLKCRPCHESFLLFEAMIEKQAESETGAFELVDAPDTFTVSVMERVRLLPPLTLKKPSARADIVFRVLCGLFAVMLGVGLYVMYNPEAVNALLTAYPALSGIAAAFNGAAAFMGDWFGRFLPTFGALGQWFASLLENVSNMSFVIMALLMVALTVVLMQENHGKDHRTAA